MYNLSRTVFADNSVLIKAYSRPVGHAPSVKKKPELKTGNRYLDEPIKTSSGLAFQETVLSDDVLKRNKERSKNNSIIRSKIAVETLARCNKWLYFVTLTLSPDNANAESYSDASKVLQLYFDRLRKKHPDIKYIAILEKGGKKDRWHIHALVSGCKLNMIDSGHKDKHHDTVYNLTDSEYDLGFTTVTYVRSTSKVSKYIVKYIKKSFDDIPTGKKRYWASRNLVTGEDVTVKYLADYDELQMLISEYKGSADRVSKSYVSELDMEVLYFNFYAEPEI